MFGSTILDVAIGLVFVYLILSLMCTTVNEWIASLFRTRAKTLTNGLHHLLGEQDVSGIGKFIDAFNGHPLIKSISKDGRYPSYISPRSFALAVMDVCTPGKHGPITFDDLQKGATDLPDGELKKTLLALLQNTDKTLDSAQRRIEDWFNDSMDRVSGWFKRKTQWITVVVAIFITLFANADTLRISNKLWSSPTLRAEVVERARVRAEGPKPLLTAEYTDTNPKPSRPSAVVQPQATADESGLSSQVQAQLTNLIGWSDDYRRFKQLSVERKSGAFFWWIWWLVTHHFAGWALTVVAISLGAPFWFDALKGLVNLRGAGKPPQPSETSESKTPEK